MGNLQHTCPQVQNVQQFLTKNSMTLMPHPPCLPDLARATFVCFPGWKKVLKGKDFADVEEVKQKKAETLKCIKIDKFRNYFEW